MSGSTFMLNKRSRIGKTLAIHGWLRFDNELKSPKPRIMQSIFCLFRSKYNLFAFKIENIGNICSCPYDQAYFASNYLLRNRNGIANKIITASKVFAETGSTCLQHLGESIYLAKIWRDSLFPKRIYPVFFYLSDYLSD